MAKLKGSDPVVKGAPRIAGGVTKRIKSVSRVERRKAWVRDTAASILRSDDVLLDVKDEARKARIYRAVDSAALIWSCVEGRFMESEDNAKG